MAVVEKMALHRPASREELAEPPAPGTPGNNGTYTIDSTSTHGLPGGSAILFYFDWRRGNIPESWNLRCFVELFVLIKHTCRDEAIILF